MTSPNEEQERRWQIFRARRKHYLGTPADLADIPASDLMTARQRLHAAAQQGDQEAWTYAVLADAEMHRRDALKQTTHDDRPTHRCKGTLHDRHN